MTSLSRRSSFWSVRRASRIPARTKNAAAVALGKRTSAKKKKSSKENARKAAGRPPEGVSYALWRAVRAKAYEEGISMHALRTELFRAYLEGRIVRDPDED